MIGRKGQDWLLFSSRGVAAPVRVYEMLNDRAIWQRSARVVAVSERARRK